MKRAGFTKMHVINILTLIFVFAFSNACEKASLNIDDSKHTTNNLHQRNEKSGGVTILNPGFENDFTNWTDIDPSAISGDAYSGSKSAKITGSGAEVSQIVSINQNTDYNLSAYVKGSWRIGVYVNGQKISRSGNTSSWKKETVNFNSSSANSVKIFAQYKSGTGRFDDFELVSAGSNSNTVINIQSVTASADDGNVAANTIDGNLATRWSAKGDGQWILYDLGNSYTLSELQIAWYKGDQRQASFDVYSGNDINNLSNTFSGTSSGTSLNLESYDISGNVARYVKIIGHGNSSNTWNSITETKILGTSSNSGGDTTPPADVSNLKATPSDGSVSLSWTNPQDNDFNHVVISYSGGSQTTSATSANITGLTNGNSYTFTVVAYDNTGNASQGVSVTSTPSATIYPSDIIPGLTHWKVALPVDSNGNDSSNETDYHNRNTNAWEVYNLTNFEYQPYFDAINSEVVFRAHCAGATTSGSKYPRSELRQLVGGGNNYWSVNKHQYLQVELRVTHTPVEKPEVCMTQIHGPQNEPLRVQYHASKGLYLVWNESNKKYFSNQVPYTLGQKLRITVEVNNGDITCTVLNLDNNKSFTYSWTSNDSTGYFKVGCYTQSSIFLSQFKSGYNDESMDAYGEVRVSKISLTETY